VRQELWSLRLFQPSTEPAARHCRRYRPNHPDVPLRSLGSTLRAEPGRPEGKLTLAAKEGETGKGNRPASPALQQRGKRAWLPTRVVGYGTEPWRPPKEM